jgi:hypothetical protein
VTDVDGKSPRYMKDFRKGEKGEISYSVTEAGRGPSEGGRPSSLGYLACLGDLLFRVSRSTLAGAGGGTAPCNTMPSAGTSLP